VYESAVLIRDEAGTPLYWQGLLQDITERMRAEEELRESSGRDAGDREKALEAGMDDYLANRVKSGELEAVLKRWVFRSEGQKNTLEEVTADTDLPTGATEPLDQSMLEGLRELGGQGVLEELKDPF
jgi:PAS domain-containing protein